MVRAQRRRIRASGVRWWPALGAVPIGVRIAGLLLRTTLSSRSAPRPGPGAVVVLGWGFEGDAVPRVLAGRLDRAAAIYRAGSAAGQPPLLVLSGGAAPNGGRTEAAAMAAYLSGLGMPALDLVLEDRSTATQENLRYSAALLADRAVAPPVVVVTSDFHVWRTAALARRLGLEVQVVGVATAASLRIPAVLRELRLLLGQHGWSTAAGCVALTAALLCRPQRAPTRRTQ
ncbi:MAG: hypothetical protein JWR70_376 [Modestobacter sp.]|nr:hypothetical protein [Modestobacter sp.]